MSVPSIPDSFSHKLYPKEDFNVNTDVSGALTSNVAGALTSNIAGTLGAVHSGELNTKVSGSLTTDNVLKLTGDEKTPVATTSKMDIVNLPHFSLQDIKDMMKIRVHIPNYSNVCFKLMGMELFSICMSGESQIISEPYVENAAERCETDCCEPDTRPFPTANDQGIRETDNKAATATKSASTAIAAKKASASSTKKPTK